MIVITLPNQRARNFNNRTTAWMWLKKMRPEWYFSRDPVQTLGFMAALDDGRNPLQFHTKHGLATVTQEVRP